MEKLMQYLKDNRCYLFTTILKGVSVVFFLVGMFSYEENKEWCIYMILTAWIFAMTASPPSKMLRLFDRFTVLVEDAESRGLVVKPVPPEPDDEDE